MEHIHRVLELHHINDAPFSQDVYAEFLYPATDAGHGLPIVRFKSALNGIELKARGFTRLVREVPEVVQA
jgi:hypothetical protein